MRKYTVAVDFDGVIHSYTSGWREDWMTDPIKLLDPPVEGAIRWLMQIRRDLEVVLLTTRGGAVGSGGAVMKWLRHYGYEGDDLLITNLKVPALAYVDDRGWRFMGPGTFPSAGDILRAKPWFK